MFYVFLVDTGTMLHLDMKLALDSVDNLKENIARIYKIPVDKQVLLISGGESLEPTTRVCSYSAGTDTNPIFLFSKSSIEASIPPIPSNDFSSDVDLKDQVEGCLDLPPTYQTVVSRADLAQEFYDLAQRLILDCERLVHEQHLQQQGWAAVVANLEDITQSFYARAERFDETYNSYLKSRQESMTLLKNYSDDLEILAMIPILPALLEHTEQNNSCETDFSLLQWISSKDNNRSLEEIASICSRGLHQLDENLLDSVQTDLKLVLDESSSTHMKEVKGLEDRLYGLDQLMHECKMVVREQGDQAQAFVQNQTRAGNLGDPSILPDLCTSHRKQLIVMLKNHQQLLEIRSRCSRAKEELVINLHTRLRWVMYVERKMCDVDNRLVIYHENLKRLKCHMEIVQQIHQAPAIYLEAVAEVVRRRYFAETFVKSATSLSHRATDVYNKEMEMRKAFMAKLNNHFLQSLFTGMNDYPPPFATQAPPPFDVNLPALDNKDIELLRNILPNMESHLQFTTTMPSLWTQHSVVDEGFYVTQTATPVPGALAQVAGGVLDTFVHLHPMPLGETSHMECSFAQNGGAAAAVFAKESSMEIPPVETKSTLPTDGKSASTTADERKARKCSHVLLSYAEDVDGEPKDQPESETEEFEKVEKILEPSDPEGANRGDDDEGITGAKQRKLEGEPPLSSTVHQLSDCSDEEKIPKVPATAARPVLQDRGVATDEPFPCERVIMVTPSGDPDNGTLSSARATDKLKEQESQLTNLGNTLHSLHKLDVEKTGQMKADISALRSEVKGHQEEIFKYIEKMNKNLQEVFADVHHRINHEQDQILQSTKSSLQAEHEKLVADLRKKSDKDYEKLKEAQQQMEDYKERLSHANNLLEATRQQYAAEMEKVQERLEQERHEEVKRLALEHELELDGAKEEMKATLESKEAEIRDVAEAKTEVEWQMQKLRREIEELEENLRQQFQKEKDDSFKALEGLYMEREADVVSKLRKEYEAKLDDTKEKLVKEYEEKLKHAYSECQASIMQLDENVKHEALQEQHWVWELEKQQALDSLTIEAEEERQALRVQHAGEIDNLHQAAAEELKEAVAAAEAEAFAVAEDRANTLQAQFEAQLRMKEMEHEKELEEIVRKSREENLSAFEMEIEKLRADCEAEKCALRAELETQLNEYKNQRDHDMKDIQDKLMQDHRYEIESLQSRFRMCVSTTNLSNPTLLSGSASAPTSPVGRSPADEKSVHDDSRLHESVPVEGEMIPLFRHESLIAEAKQAAYDRGWAEAGNQLHKTQEEETFSLIESLKQTHQEQLLSIRASIMGEKQACFNEAVNKVIHEKDIIIEQLRSKEKTLLYQLQEDKKELEKFKQEGSLAASLDSDVEQDGSMSALMKSLESEDVVLKSCHKETKDTSDLILSVSALSSSDIVGDLTVSVAPVTGHERILELEQNLKQREEEICKLQNQLMELSTSCTIASVSQDKVSVISCNVGDLVLLCYDERHDNYLVFLVCPTYHFLHPDSLELLGLKPAPGEPRKAWILAEVVDKEYCQTKKAQNRYRVPLGTKFFRVKAKPWDREPPMLRDGAALAAAATSSDTPASTPTHGHRSRRRSSCCEVRGSSTSPSLTSAANTDTMAQHDDSSNSSGSRP